MEYLFFTRKQLFNIL